MIKNSSERKYYQDKFILDFLDSPCPEVECDDSEYNESMAECRAMIEYNQDINNKSEVKFWRQQLQKIKTEKRITQRLMESNINCEVETI